MVDGVGDCVSSRLGQATSVGALLDIPESPVVDLDNLLQVITRSWL